MADELENDPMFCIGRMFHEANRIHERFFTSRGGKPPPELIGYRYLRMACNNPQYALRLFHTDFCKYLSWAVSRHSAQRRAEKPLDQHFSPKTYREMVEKVGTNIPVRPSDLDIIKIANGFAFRKSVQQPSEEVEEQVT